jgi:hypothetical protein
MGVIRRRNSKDSHVTFTVKTRKIYIYTQVEFTFKAKLNLLQLKPSGI